MKLARDVRRRDDDRAVASAGALFWLALVVTACEPFLEHLGLGGRGIVGFGHLLHRRRHLFLIHGHLYAQISNRKHAIHVLQEDSTGGATARRRPPRGRSLFTGDIWTRRAFSSKMCTGLGIWASIFRPRTPHGARQDPSAGLAKRARHVAADAGRNSFPVSADAAMSASSS